MSKKILACLATLSCIALPYFASAEEAPKTEQIARGLLMQHAGKMIFAPCRERTYAEINDTSPGQQIGNALTKLGLAEKKPLYVEFVGQLDGATLKVSAINFASTQARCQASTKFEEKWRGLGHGPRWALRVGENLAKLEQEGQPDVTLSDTELKIDGETARIEFKPGVAEQWTFRRGLCRGEDNTSLFGWQAELKRANGTLRGCAWQGY